MCDRCACSEDSSCTFARFTAIVSLFVSPRQLLHCPSQYRCCPLPTSPYEKNAYWVSRVRYECCNPSGDLLPSLTFSSRFVNFFVALLNLFVALRQPPLTRRKHTGLTTSDMSVAILCSKCSPLAFADCSIFVFHHVLYTTVSRFLSDTLCHSLA